MMQRSLQKFGSYFANTVFATGLREQKNLKFENENKWRVHGKKQAKSNFEILRMAVLSLKLLITGHL